MKLYSTNNKNKFVSLKEAVFKGLPEDNGLFMPEHIPTLPDFFFKNLKELTFQEIGFEVCKTLFKDAISKKDIRKIVESAITFPAPLVHLDDKKKILELFHGPSLAFKDFGARFMAQLMGYFNESEKEELNVLVATSGDTGGAVAAGFHKTPGINIIILYPSGKVSLLQEKQLTTLGHNITALEVDGTFDDCQALVKNAFLDKDLNDKMRLSSANSINIARLIPQSFYYFEAYKQLKGTKKKVVFSVPSGNFGNLTAGLLAKKMGLNIHSFIAATNINKVVPDYLSTGVYTPRTSERTLSNAMDVGNPSNFVRMIDLYGSTWNKMKQFIKGFYYTDLETEVAIREVYKKYGYVIDPHGAVGYLALKEYQNTSKDTCGIILETAHPSKFKEDLDRILDHKIKVPKRLSELAEKKKTAFQMPNSFSSFKDWLINKAG